MKKYNKKGFTLIEMLGVIVIIGLIMIVAIPTMSKLIHSNKNQKYSSYYSTVQEAAIAYASKLDTKLGNSKNSGCAQIDLATLIDSGYVDSYTDSDVTCTTAPESGIDYKIKIRNNKGKISANFRLICKNNENGDIEYDSGTDSADSNSCDAYAMAEEINIKTQLDSDDSLSKETPSDSNITYITGTNPNNYIWYSGKMWRIVSYNSSTDAVKAVTVNPISSNYYNNAAVSSFSNSDIETWLNNDFLNSLKDPQNFLTSYNWNYTANSDMNTNNSNSASYKKLKVGLITTYEYGRIKNWYGNSTSWLLSEGTGGYSLYTNNGNIGSTSSTTIRSIRPVIVFSSDVLVYDGDGSSTNPYIIDNSENAVGLSDEYINTRFSGEYVSFNGLKYRIVSTTSTSTKLIATSSVGKYDFDAADAVDDGYYLYSTSNLKTRLDNMYSSVTDYLTNGDFCMDTINNNNRTYRSASCLTSARLITTKVGLPKIGDLFTTTVPNVNENYWTINPNTEVDVATGQSYASTINLIQPTGEATSGTISETCATVPVIYLDSSVKISGGSGTSNSPYTLKK